MIKGVVVKRDLGNYMTDSESFCSKYLERITGFKMKPGQKASVYLKKVPDDSVRGFWIGHSRYWNNLYNVKKARRGLMGEDYPETMYRSFFYKLTGKELAVGEAHKYRIVKMKKKG